MSEQYTETVVIIRPSFKKITAKEEKTDACRAALFNHFLYWIARKAKGLTEEQIQKGEFSWYATEDQITTDGLGEAWCKKKVSKEIDILVANELVGRRHNTTNKWDQTRHYYLSEKEGAKIKEHCINAGICLNHLGLPPCVVQLLESLNAIGQYSIWKCQICRMSNGKCTTAIPKVSTKVSTKGVVILTDTDSQSTDTPTLSDDVAPDYETSTQPSMQLSTQQATNVDKSAESENRSHSQQSYSHRQDTSPATHVGVMPVLSVPMPPGVSAVQGKPQTPATPPSETLDEKKRLGLIAESIREKAPDIKGVTIAVLKFIDAWDQGKYGPCSLSRWEISNAKDIVLRMKGTIEDALLIADELKRQNKTVKIETVCNCWYLLETLKKPLSVSSHPNLYNEDNFAKDVWA